MAAGDSVVPRSVYTDDFHDVEALKDTLRASPEYEAQKSKLDEDYAKVTSVGTSEIAGEETTTTTPTLRTSNVGEETANPGILERVKEKVLGVAA